MSQKLTERDAKVVLGKLDGKVGICPVCEIEPANWTISTILSIIPTAFDINRGTPAITIACVHCGYLMIFAAEVFGIDLSSYGMTAIKEDQKDHEDG